MQVLIACEFSGVVRDAFIEAGHQAISIDLLPSEGIHKEFHIQGDIREVIADGRLGVHLVDLMIAHPPCTKLCSSGLFRNKNNPERQKQTEEALQFVSELMDMPIDKICIENPVGCISTRIRPASQYIQPHDFGHDASKKTGLWLKNLPNLVPTKYIKPRVVDGKKRWANQTDSGQNNLPPSPDRWKLRSVTYQGIANAMVSQWS